MIMSNKSIGQLHREANTDPERMDSGREIKRFYCHNCREEKDFNQVESKRTHGEWNISGDRYQHFCTACRNRVTPIT
jgi:hypothetical protein